jgi:hypothetical protein
MYNLSYFVLKVDDELTLVLSILVILFLACMGIFDSLAYGRAARVFGLKASTDSESKTTTSLLTEPDISVSQ